MDSAKIGSFIQKCRKEKKLTQEELGEILGVSGKSISRWENNVTMPDLSLVTTIAKELDVQVSELLNGERSNEKKLIELGSEIDKMTKYDNYEEKSRTKKVNILLLAQIIILLLVLVNKFIVPTDVSIHRTISISLGIIGLIISFILLHKNKKKKNFKINNVCLFEDNSKEKISKKDNL